MGGNLESAPFRTLFEFWLLPFYLPHCRSGSRASADTESMATTKYRSMRGYFLWFAVGGLALTSSFLAAPTVDAAAGKEKAEICAGCHGDNGISQMENIPSLSSTNTSSGNWCKRATADSFGITSTSSPIRFPMSSNPPEIVTPVMLPPPGRPPRRASH